MKKTIMAVVILGIILISVIIFGKKFFAGEGQVIGAKNMPKWCYPGLKPIGSCVFIEAPGGLSVCSKCGDGICNQKTNERKCNCPKDCK